MIRKWDIQFSWNPWFSLGLHFDHTDPSITMHLLLLIICVGRCKQPGFKKLKLKFSDPDDGGPYLINPPDIKFNYDPPENNKKYELPKMNIRHIVYHDGKYICMLEDEWNNVRDKLLAWKALLILADKDDKEVDNG